MVHEHISERELQLPDIAIGKLLQIAAEDKSVLSLGPGEPDFELPKPLVAEVKRLANKVNHYAPPGGYLKFREAFCKKLRKQNKINVSPDNIVAACGSQEALMIAAAVTLDVSENILLPNPGYMAFCPTFELFNAFPKFYPLKESNNYEPDPDEIKKLIDRKKTKAILLNSPSNPTGNVIRKKVLEEIADIAVQHDLLVYSDEAYEHILFDNARHVSMASLNGMKDHTLSFFSFSKSYAMCGFRLGCVVASDKISEAIKKTHVYTTVCAPSISQFLGVKALSLSNKYTEAMVKEYDERRKVIVPRLNDMGLSTPMPKGAFYAFANVSRINRNSNKFALDLLNKEKVAVVPGIDFGSEGEGHVRFSFATKLPIIEKALDRIERFVRKKQ